LMVLDSGKPWKPEAFQLEFAEDLFAGTRENWLVVPEGNGKTTLLSGLALYHGDYTQDAMVTMAASSRCNRDGRRAIFRRRSRRS